ncbi:MAG: hypothetical protein HZA54_15280, partial [Planctomycetes bacterium]|nr:hypothetical protein [Planctomycetota bacterium]
MKLPTLLAGVLGFGALAATAEEPVPAYRLTALAPAVAPTSAKRARDRLGGPDWGLAVDGAGVTPARLEMARGGSCCFEAAPGAAPRARLIALSLGEILEIDRPVSLPVTLAPERRTLAFGDGSTVEIELVPFAADGESGDDALPTGAAEARLGHREVGELDFGGGDRTDHWACELDRPSWVECLIYHPDARLAAAWVGAAAAEGAEGAGGGFTAPDPAKAFTLFQGKRPAGRQVLRLRAAPNARTRYELVVVRRRAGAGTRAPFVRALLDRAAHEAARAAAPDGERADAYPAAARAVLVTLDAPEVRDALRAGLDHRDG